MLNEYTIKYFYFYYVITRLFILVEIMFIEKSLKLIISRDLFFLRFEKKLKLTFKLLTFIEKQLKKPREQLKNKSTNIYNWYENECVKL